MAATPKPASRAQVEKQFRDMLLADLPGQVLTTPTMYLAAAPVHPWPQPLCIPGCSPCAFSPCATPRTKAATPDIHMRVQAPIDLGPGHRQQLVPHPPTSPAARSSTSGAADPHPNPKPDPHPHPKPGPSPNPTPNPDPNQSGPRCACSLPTKRRAPSYSQCSRPTRAARTALRRPYELPLALALPLALPLALALALPLALPLALALPLPLPLPLTRHRQHLEGQGREVEQQT